MTTNFPYRPLGGTRVPGFDLLADWLGYHDKPASKPVEDAWEEASSVISQALTAVQEGSTLAGEGASSVLSSAAASSTPLAASKESPAEAEPSTDFMLFLGDFIYADVPVYAGGNTEAFRKLYRRNYKSNSVRRVYERLRKFFSGAVVFARTDNHSDFSDFPHLRRPRGTLSVTSSSSSHRPTYIHLVHQQLRRPGYRGRAFPQRLRRVHDL